MKIRRMQILILLCFAILWLVGFIAALVPWILR
jgi:hypothetical protein